MKFNKDLYDFESNDTFKINVNETFNHELIRYVNHLKKQIVFEQQMNRYKNLVIAALFTGIEERDKQIKELKDLTETHDVILDYRPTI